SATPTHTTACLPLVAMAAPRPNPHRLRTRCHAAPSPVSESQCGGLTPLYTCGTLAIVKEFGSFDSFLWRYVDGIPVQNKWKAMYEIAPTTEQSDAISKDLKRRGFNFVGSTICDAFMEAGGMVNDHTKDYFRHKEIKTFARPDKSSVRAKARR
ncbi:MAG: DNA-3-methyladenine glycosylase I, partial [Kiritimatiellia bacterium]